MFRKRKLQAVKKGVKVSSVKIDSRPDSKKAKEDDIVDEDIRSDDEVEVEVSDLAKRRKQTQDDEDDEREKQLSKESLDERRLKVAKQYLDKLSKLESGKFQKSEEEPAQSRPAASSASASSIIFSSIASSVPQGEQDEAGQSIHDAIAAKLKAEVSRAEGFVSHKVLPRLEKRLPDLNSGSIVKFHRGHRLSPTCIAMPDDDLTAYTGSKDGSIIRWDITTGRKVTTFTNLSKGKKDILSLAASSDGRYLASGSKSNVVKIFDTRSGGLIPEDSLLGHKITVSSLAFRMGTHQLFSASHDRTIKIWDLDEMMYLDSLYGHESEVMSVHALFKDRCLSSGRDKSVRLWKVQEESQLVFGGLESIMLERTGQISSKSAVSHMGSVDCCALIDDGSFVSGGDDSSVCLWSIGKRKPVMTIRNAHSGKWITSVASLPHADLAASGSSDGFIRVWGVNMARRWFRTVASIPVQGFVNGLAFSNSGKFLVAAVGQEHKSGRWERVPGPEARNGILIAPILDEGLDRSTEMKDSFDALVEPEERLEIL